MNMASAFSADTQLLEWFRYWAIWEAACRVNILPVSSNPDDPTDLASMTTPHFKFYDIKSDYWTLLPFGAVGSFRQVRDNNCNRTQFKSQGMLGIALGWSEYTNGVVFYNPVLYNLSTSVDYLLDKSKNIGDIFPSIQYDGGLVTSVLSNKDNKLWSLMLMNGYSFNVRSLMIYLKKQSWHQQLWKWTSIQYKWTMERRWMLRQRIFIQSTLLQHQASPRCH